MAVGRLSPAESLKSFVEVGGGGRRLVFFLVFAFKGFFVLLSLEGFVCWFWVLS